MLRHDRGGGAGVAEDAGIGGVEHDDAAVMHGGVVAADGFEGAVPDEQRVEVGHACKWLR